MKIIVSAKNILLFRSVCTKINYKNFPTKVIVNENTQH